MGERGLERDGQHVVRQPAREREAGGGGGEGLETQMPEGSGGPHVPRVGEHEAAGLVQLGEGGDRGGLGGRGVRRVRVAHRPILYRRVRVAAQETRQDQQEHQHGTHQGAPENLSFHGRGVRLRPPVRLGPEGDLVRGLAEEARGEEREVVARGSEPRLAVEELEAAGFQARPE